MGIYCYTLRAKTVQLVMPSGAKVAANLMSYAYKLSSMWRGDYGYKSYTFTTENAKRNADNAFASTRSGVVIIGEVKDGLEGASVYEDLTDGVWFDCDGFPGKLVGWVQKAGRGYAVADRTKWCHGSVHRDGAWVPMRERTVMVDGKATEEMEDLTPPPEQSELTNPMDHII
jgi:hypothetical protein